MTLYKISKNNLNLQKKMIKKWKQKRRVKKQDLKKQKFKQKKKHKFSHNNNNRPSKDQEKLNRIFQLLQMQMHLQQEWLIAFLLQILRDQWIFIWKEQHTLFKCQLKE